MRIFVTGATGFIGSAIVKELLGHGHQVLGLVRSDANAQKLAAAGAEVHRGSLEELDSLSRGARACEAVIHTAFNHDFVNVSREVAAAADVSVVNTLGEALAGTNRPFIISTGTGFVQGHARTETEEGAQNPRVASEHATVAFATRGVRAMVMGLPPSVHGDGDHGLVHALIEIAKAKGASAYVGDGANRWPAVHRFDAAQLYRLAIEKGTAGTRFHAVAEEGVPTKQIAEVIGRKLKLPLVSKAGKDVAEHFGWLGMFFSLDLPASSARTRELTGWRPTQSGLIQDVEAHYFK